MRTILLTATAAAVLAALPALAGSEKEYVPDVETEALHKAPLPGVEGKEVIVMRFKAPPGYIGERHQHPGPVYVFILSGEMEVETEAGTQTIGAGEFIEEPMNVTMQPRNTSDSEPVDLLVFQIGDVGRPMMVKVD